MKKTIPQVFFTEKKAPCLERTALLTRGKEDNGQVAITRSSLEHKVRELAMGLLALGVSRGSRVALMMEGSPNWPVSDLAVSSTGAVTVPVYTTLGPEEVFHILMNSACSTIIGEPRLLKKVLGISGRLPELKRIISSSEPVNPDGLTIKRVRALGAESGDPALFLETLKGTTPGDPFSIIYTSGTTGLPKGVVLTHANVLSNIEAVLKVVDVRSTDLYLSYLPISHVFERMIHHLFLYLGAPIAYSRGFAYVGSDITHFRPTVMAGVPFFFERVRGRIEEKVAKAGGFKKFLFELAMSANKHSSIFAPLLDRLALKGIREKAAPGLKFFISGGAALGKDNAEFFSSLGIPLLEGYGLTETSPVITVNPSGADKPGTVGVPIPGVELRLGEDGEVLVKGPGVMKGYLNMPEATEEVTGKGWFHTGDLGSIDEDGYLTIIGRKKDIIVTSAGKNISTQRIETLLRADGYIKEALVYGDKRPHLVALIVPDPERLTEARAEAGVEEDADLTDKTLTSFFESRVRRRLEGLARFEQVRHIALIDELTIDSGELTPTMKVKREKVALKYTGLINGLYA